ncbi:hypothetical protein DPMN_024785 [Dreissena polymorpha]|uniref:Uncharacterized protein n=1 Tax=Dreissena polymorpha TaxID=45954 RepID=A0A9D4LQ69_DREPO|nr:hypothetical protein DPMN_024785 [Dreissena polymorpha]
MVQLDKLDRKYKAAEEKVNLEISRLSERKRPIWRARAVCSLVRFLTEFLIRVCYIEMYNKDV